MMRRAMPAAHTQGNSQVQVDEPDRAADGPGLNATVGSGVDVIAVGGPPSGTSVAIVVGVA
jgi:hypothetical protein